MPVVDLSIPLPLSLIFNLGRGSSLSNTRGGRGYGRSGYLGSRRGSSLPHQHPSNQGHRLSSRYGDRNQRRTRRQEPQAGLTFYLE